MRTFGTQSAFDVIVVITLGGILGRCIMGHYPFFASLASAGCLAVLHKFASFLSSRSHIICKLLEGDPVLLFDKGEMQWRKLRKYDITQKEMMAAIHEQGMDSFEKVKAIWLEPDGKIAVIKKSPPKSGD